MSALHKVCWIIALAILTTGGVMAQPAGDRMERDRSIGFGNGSDRRRIEVYEPPALTRSIRTRRTASRTRLSSVPPWWEIVDDVAARRRDRRAAWYFGLPAPYQYRRFQ